MRLEIAGPRPTLPRHLTSAESERTEVSHESCRSGFTARHAIARRAGFDVAHGHPAGAGQWPAHFQRFMDCGRGPFPIISLFFSTSLKILLKKLNPFKWK